ncbi:filament-like plant protein 7 isoform X2 [Salvia hispanica]|uniref:filament-like plant protein 7 isoform X2 n=1 Tax=Salvia hispanica TaxID=49212 RepID=UPI0020095256|nr:filament-like plant protein 7 isoform X2 [Salvia hispanica]
MDQKTWLWRRKSSEKTILAILDEAQTVSIEKEVDLENSLKLLNEKLASAADECSAKDELVLSYKREAEVAAADRRKAEEEICRLRQELDEAQQQRSAANERLGHLNSTLKNCMEQLNLARQDQEQRMRDAVMQTSEEFEKSHKKLEEKLSETRKRLASLDSENSCLNKAVAVKEKIIEDLNSIKIQTQAELEALMARLDSVEKENAFLKYEYRSVEKELELKNKEIECSRRSAESSLKQHMENVKKIKKLEVECQRLRGLIRKGPTMLARDMETQGRKQISTRRKATCGGSPLQGHGDVYGLDLENTSKQLRFLIDQVQDLQKENTVFKEFLAKKDEEIFHLRKLKDSESHEKSEHKLVKNTVAVDEIGSRALALVSECQMIGASEMSLMDDFVEMEKLAIVSVEPPCGGSFDVESNRLALVVRDTSSETEHDLIKARDTFCKKIDDDWLQNVTNMILEQHNASQRSIDELLEDIRVSSRNIRHPEASQQLPISGYITWKSPPSSPSPAVLSMDSLQPDMNRSITKLIELIVDMNSSKVDGDYEIRAFRWKKSDLTAVLEEFIDSCNKLLNGKISFVKFTVDLAYILEWVMNSCVSLQDHSTVTDEFRKHLGGEGPGTALELESVQNLMLEMEKMHSACKVEIKGLKNELSFIKSSSQVSSPLFRRKGNEALLHKLAQSQQGIASQQNEIEALKGSKRVSEDQLENLKVVNEDLETQLTVSKAKLHELLQKLSCAEVELDDKSHCCQELEGTCLELQLQLESIANNPYAENHENQGGLLQTGMEITAEASAKLAECEEAIVKLGKQLKALGTSAKELDMSDSRKQNSKQHSSLREQMMFEDNGQVNNEESPQTKQIISTTVESVPSACNYKAISFPDSQVATPATYLKSGALVIVPSKRKGGGGVGFLRKLLIRRKKSSSKNTSIYFGK